MLVLRNINSWEEHFLMFCPINKNTSSYGLTNFLLDALGKYSLKVSVLGGQRYDNGAQHDGIQKRILD